jgi:hypothetical protein
MDLPSIYHKHLMWLNQAVCEKSERTPEKSFGLKHSGDEVHYTS